MNLKYILAAYLVVHTTFKVFGGLGLGLSGGFINRSLIPVLITVGLVSVSAH